jgi:AcrR family transcriptional regulator
VPRAGLTEDIVVAEAERMADEVGLENVTMAALAQRLGVRQPSLYKHVASLPALRRAIGLRTMTALTGELARAAVGRSGADALMAMALAFRAWVKAHPGRYEAGQRAPEPGDTAYETAAASVIELFTSVLWSFELSGDDAIDAIRSLRAAMHGFVSLELLGGFAIPLDIDRSYERLVAAVIGSLRNQPPAAVGPNADDRGGLRPYPSRRNPE